ncbi:uncharacterized protein F5Z01DRAFT_649781, partial [Emericellopsis atlantica]
MNDLPLRTKRESSPESQIKTESLNDLFASERVFNNIPVFGAETAGSSTAAPAANTQSSTVAIERQPAQQMNRSILKSRTPGPGEPGPSAKNQRRPPRPHGPRHRVSFAPGTQGGRFQPARASKAGFDYHAQMAQKTPKSRRKPLLAPTKPDGMKMMDFVRGKKNRKLDDLASRAARQTADAEGIASDATMGRMKELGVKKEEED